MTIRPYNPEQDREAIHRIWREVRWIENEKQERALDFFLERRGRIHSRVHRARLEI